MGFPAHLVAKIVRHLEDGGIPVWVDGGWGVDALLGKQTRVHRDLDLVISFDNVAGAESILNEIGLARDHALTTMPMRFVMRMADGLRVDFRPVKFMPDGSAEFTFVVDRTGELVSFDFSAAGLLGSGMIANQVVRCPTAAEQARQKAERGFSPWTHRRIGQDGISVDLADIIALQREFGDRTKDSGKIADKIFLEAVQRFYVNHVTKLSSDHTLLTDYHVQLSEARERLRAVERSTSWRVTAPLRWMGRWLGRRFQRGVDTAQIFTGTLF